MNMCKNVCNDLMYVKISIKVDEIECTVSSTDSFTEQNLHEIKKIFERNLHNSDNAIELNLHDSDDAIEKNCNMRELIRFDRFRKNCEQVC